MVPEPEPLLVGWLRSDSTADACSSIRIGNTVLSVAALLLALRHGWMGMFAAPAWSTAVAR
jgi:hypothetical protein